MSVSVVMFVVNLPARQRPHTYDEACNRHHQWLVLIVLKDLWDAKSYCQNVRMPSDHVHVSMAQNGVDSPQSVANSLQRSAASATVTTVTTVTTATQRREDSVAIFSCPIGLACWHGKSQMVSDNQWSRYVQIRVLDPWAMTSRCAS